MESEPENTAKSNVCFVLEDVEGSTKGPSTSTHKDYSMPPQLPLGAQERFMPTPLRRVQESPQYSLGEQASFYIECYRILRMYCDVDVVNLIFRILLSLGYLTLNNLGLKCARNLFFPVGSEVYGSGYLDEFYAPNSECNIMKLPVGNVIQMACGNSSQLLLLGAKDGSESLYANGANNNGELGLVDCLRRQFVKIPFFENGKQGKVISIHCGAHFSIVLTTTGLFGFGSNEMGQLGVERQNQPNQQPFKTATPIEMLSRTPEIDRNSIKAIYTGFTNTMILMVDGTVYACGDNMYGQLGLDKDVRAAAVFKLTKVVISGVVDIALGKGWTVFHTLDGLIVSDFGPASGFSRIDCSIPFVPVLLPTFEKIEIASIKCGEHHLVVLTEKGDLYACGDNKHSQIGVPSTVLTVSRLTKISTLSNVTQFQCGAQFTLAIADGKFYYWGDTTIRMKQEQRAEKSATTPIELPYYQTLLQEAGLLPKSKLTNQPATVSTQPASSLASFFVQPSSSSSSFSEPASSWGAEFSTSDVVWI